MDRLASEAAVPVLELAELVFVPNGAAATATTTPGPKTPMGEKPTRAGVRKGSASMIGKTSARVAYMLALIVLQQLRVAEHMHIAAASEGVHTAMAEDAATDVCGCKCMPVSEAGCMGHTRYLVVLFVWALCCL